MHLLKKFLMFGKIDSSGDKIPSGKITIKNNRIICIGYDDNKYDCKINIDNIEYAYVVVNKNKNSFLYLAGYNRGKYLPTNFSGFDEVYSDLSQKLGFNDKVFFQNINSNIRIQKQIWRRKHPSDFKLLENSTNDYGQGFEILSPKTECISWDTTYKELIQNQNVFAKDPLRNQNLYSFKYPVRIGNLIFKEFYFDVFEYQRTDIAVLGFYGYCHDATNSDKSYYQIRDLLWKDFPEDEKLIQSEGEGKNAISFQDKGILFSFSYGYDYNYDWDDNGYFQRFENGRTRLSVCNKREYPELLNNTEYESNIEVSAVLELDSKLSMVVDYKKNKRIKYRPNTLKPDVTIIWRDDKNSKIGFAYQNYCQVFDKDQITQFRIQNILPAKGGGSSYLEINLKDNSNRFPVLGGACKKIDNYKEQIEQLTGIEVVIAPETYDC